MEVSKRLDVLLEFLKTIARVKRSKEESEREETDKAKSDILHTVIHARAPVPSSSEFD